MKKCAKCKTDKDESEYSLSQWKHRYGRCRDCNTEYIKQYRQDNKEQFKEYCKQHYQKNKERQKQYCQSRKNRYVYVVTQNETGKPVYIGCTSNPPNQRISCHANQPRLNHQQGISLTRWHQHLFDSGVTNVKTFKEKFTFTPIPHFEQINSDEEMLEREQAVINLYIEMGYELYNKENLI